MEAEEIPRSKRLLREHRMDGRELVADPHINPAFSGDEAVLMELIAEQRAAGEIDSEDSIRKDNLGSASTNQGYNMLGDGTGSFENPTHEHAPIHQAKENKGVHQPPHPPSHELESPSSGPMAQASHDSLVEHHVGFKLGLKHSSKTHAGVLKDAENTTFQNNDSQHVVSIPDVKSEQNQAGLQHPQKTSADIEIVTEGKSVPSGQSEGNTGSAGAMSPAQRRWKSAMNTQAKSLPAAVERLHSGIAARWQSMRLARQTPAQPRSLLSQLSFSDSDATCIHDYGALEGGEAIPRKPPKSVNDASGQEVKLPPTAIKVFAGLMEQLLKRGKIREVALLNQSGGAPVTLRPMSWNIPAIVATGLARAIKETTQPLVRLMINDDVYVCLNHGSDRVVGHSNDNDVLVAQKTNQYIVLGLSEEDTPGSCLQEVLELAEILSDKGW